MNPIHSNDPEHIVIPGPAPFPKVAISEPAPFTEVVIPGLRGAQNPESVSAYLRPIPGSIADEAGAAQRERQGRRESIGWMCPQTDSGSLLRSVRNDDQEIKRFEP